MVLAAGGENLGRDQTDTAELYNPQTGTWRYTAHKMTMPRAAHTATLLPDGRVLLAGGFLPSGDNLNTAEIFDPTTEQFQPVASLNEARRSNPAVALSDGRVMVVGGYNGPLSCFCFSH